MCVVKHTYKKEVTEHFGVLHFFLDRNHARSHRSYKSGLDSRLLTCAGNVCNLMDYSRPVARNSSR